MPRLTLLAAARWAIVLLTVVPTMLRAQFVGAAGVGASLQRDGGGLWQSITRLEPAARLTNPWLQLGGTASFVNSDRRMHMENGSLDLVAETPVWNRFRLSTSAQIERHPALAAYSHSGGSADLALTYAANGRGAWFGLASERSLRVIGSPSNDDGNGLLRLGVWQQFGPVSVVLGTARHESQQTTWKVTPPVTDTGSFDSLRTTHTALRRWSDVQARVLWSAGRVALDGQFGVQSVDSMRTAAWGRATATIAMGSRLSFVGAFGTQPARLWMGVPGRRFASLGVRIAPASLARPMVPAHVQPSARRFALRAAEAGMYVVTVAVPSARTVEISGDFNEWHPLSLKETRPDVWEATVAIAPGTYHVNMRVNGASWIAPPGLSETSDDFNGTVGLLVVP